MRRAHIGRDDVPRVVLGVAVFLVDAQRAGEVGIEFSRWNWCFSDIALLRRFAEAAPDGRTRAMRIGKVGAAIERIIGRPLEPFSLRSLCLFPSPLWGGVKGGGGR